jgi:hypothetical protein
MVTALITPQCIQQLSQNPMLVKYYYNFIILICIPRFPENIFRKSNLDHIPRFPENIFRKSNLDHIPRFPDKLAALITPQCIQQLSQNPMLVKYYYNFIILICIPRFPENIFRKSNLDHIPRFPENIFRKSNLDHIPRFPENIFRKSNLDHIPRFPDKLAALTTPQLMQLLCQTPVLVKYEIISLSLFAFLYSQKSFLENQT